jgi:ubiquinol-cytochrome c reductase iron-sulfur subunit
MRRSILCAAASAAALLGGICCEAADLPNVLEVGVADLQPGDVKAFRGQGRPYLVVRTTDAMLEDLYAQTPHTWSGREVTGAPALFVLSAAGAETGCVLLHEPAGAPRYAPGRVWQGGFYDPCRFGEWDYAGRAIRQYDDQDEAMRRPDLARPPFRVKDRSSLAVGP